MKQKTKDRIIKKYYPIYISCLLGIPIFTLTYFSIKKEYEGAFWGLILLYLLFIILQQLKWNKN